MDLQTSHNSFKSLLIDEHDDLVIERCPYCNEHIKEIKK